MNIVQINGGTVGSTGKIMLGISTVCTDEKQKTLCAAPEVLSGNKTGQNYYMIQNNNHRRLNVLLDRITGRHNMHSKIATEKLLKVISGFKPDIIQLHNLHEAYINLPMLFKYIKKHNIKTVWTLHDCWAFTGHCPHFDMIGCDKWKTGCYDCPQYKDYPKSFFDNSKYMYRLKKKWFTGVKNMTIVTPSEWLARLVKESYLKDYPVKVINNGIDLNIFKPTESDFRKKYALENKYIVLGVAFGWGKRKGLDVFIELANRLDKEKYKIVLVGTDDNVDKLLPDNIISIHRTQNQTELAEIYTAANVYVNPTREDNYPTVNMEAVACGTPVVTFNTGGSPEIIDETCGAIAEKDDTDSMYNEIIRICETKPYSEEACLKKANNFDAWRKFENYVQLYRKI